MLRDLLPTLCLLVAPAIGFFALVHRPAIATQAALRDEIAALEIATQSLPVRLAEIEAIAADVALREAFLTEHGGNVVDAAGADGLVHRIGMIASAHRLRDVRVQPLDVREGRTYRELPYRLSFTGSAAAALSFLGELERKPVRAELAALEMKPVRTPPGDAAARDAITVTATFAIVAVDKSGWSAVASSEPSQTN